MTNRSKALRLACWNADGVLARKLELEHFLKHGRVEICLLCETFLNLGQGFRLASYVCHRTDTVTWGVYSHPGPLWYYPQLSARSMPDPLGRY